MLLKETPSTAHTLLRQILQHGFFVNSCKTILHELDDDEQLCNLVVSCFCENEMIQYHLPYMTGLLQSPFRYNLCLLLLATDNISLLQAMIEEDKKLFKSDSRVKLQSLMDNGLQPLSCFSDMIIMERHFLLLILDLINAHLDEFPVISKSQNIPSFVWPIILLQNWNNPSLSDELLLQLIEKCKESTRDKTITQITYILEWYINFCKWCEKHDTSQNKEFRAENKQSLLEKAKNHSVLYLINNTTDLSLTDWLQIRDLLKQNKSKDDNKKSWDLVLFDGYCIMMLIFQAIVISSEIDHIAKSQKVKLTDISVLNDLFCSLYNEEVTSTLKKVKIMLQSLYPLAFRLEILENIFAAVFITYEDVRELSYFLNASLDFEKYLEKSQLRNKTLISEKSGNFIGGESFNIPGSSFQIFKKPEEKETTRKLKLKGFVCKKYIVRDLIYLVKECLEKLEEDPGTQWKEDNIDVPCSIKPVQVENRLDRFAFPCNYINIFLRGRSLMKIKEIR